ncbi:MAG: single-stranded DNA-binding protein [Crocinitomicaceae bacterium]|nr:single-stranded DNA-binding protein [Crocinitomicaceae bacterium]
MVEKTVNRVVLIGYVHQDPTTRYFSETNIKAYFPLVTFDIYKSETDSKKIPEFHNIIAWKNLAIEVDDKIKKGQLVEVIGRLKTNKYEKDGESKLAVQIVLSQFTVKEEAPKNPETNYPPTNEKSDLTKMDDNLFQNEEDDILPF